MHFLSLAQSVCAVFWSVQGAGSRLLWLYGEQEMAFLFLSIWNMGMSSHCPFVSSLQELSAASEAPFLPHSATVTGPVVMEPLSVLGATTTRLPQPSFPMRRKPPLSESEYPNRLVLSSAQFETHLPMDNLSPTFGGTLPSFFRGFWPSPICTIYVPPAALCRRPSASLKYQNCGITVSLQRCTSSSV